MKDWIPILQYLIEHPSHILTFIEIALTAGSLFALFKGAKHLVIQSLNRMGQMELTFAKHSNEVRTELKNHTQDTNQLVKVLQQDILKVREMILSNKEELVYRIHGLTEFINNLDLECIKVARELKMSADEFNAKFSRLFELKDEVIETRNRVILISKDMEDEKDKVQKATSILEELQKLRGKK